MFVVKTRASGNAADAAPSLSNLMCETINVAPSSAEEETIFAQLINM